MKISVNTFRWTLGDCTNKGVSSTINDFILISEDKVSEYSNFEETDNILVFVEDICCGKVRLRAIPYALYVNKTWTMFGGNFVYTSDSRFPSDQPIKIFDRVEN